MKNPLISVVIPCLDEESVIERSLEPLQDFRGKELEIVVVDGGSRDNSIERAKPLATEIFQADPGRALQMNAGAAKAQGRYLLFLHADTYLPVDTIATLVDVCRKQRPAWGFFHVRLDHSRWFYRVIEKLINWRSQTTAVATGDQCIFVDSALFKKNAGYKLIPLMEDVEITKRLKKIASPCVVKEPVFTSARKWERDGVFATIILMWRLRFAYACGADPASLHRQYYNREYQRQA